MEASFHFGVQSSRMVTWKYEYVCEIVVSPLCVILIASAPLLNGVISDVPDTHIDGIGLSSVAFSTTKLCIAIDKVGVLVKPTNACS